MKKESIFITFICFCLVYLDIAIRLIYNTIGKESAAFSFHWTILLLIMAVLYLICVSNESLIYHVIVLFIVLIMFGICIISLIIEKINFEYVISKLRLIHHISEMLLFIPIIYFQFKKIIKMYNNEI